MKQKPAERKESKVDSYMEETTFIKSEATIFINYRRDDSKDEAAYLRAIIANQFGSEKIFRDLDSIKLGANFPEVIKRFILLSEMLTQMAAEWLF
ncbi:hypothetical protein [Flavitalea sp.]|nr:hypothetical protein [Flavitalea sp.]